MLPRRKPGQYTPVLTGARRILMVDLRKLLSKRGGGQPTDPLQLFEGLDRKTSHVNLRPFQVAALKELHKRRDEREQHVVRELCRKPEHVVVAGLPYRPGDQLLPGQRDVKRAKHSPEVCKHRARRPRLRREWTRDKTWEMANAAWKNHVASNENHAVQEYQRTNVGSQASAAAGRVHRASTIVSWVAGQRGLD